MTWQIIDNQLTKTFNFLNFEEGLEFVNKIGKIAEKMGHRPTIILSYGKVIVQTATHDTNNTITPKDLELTKEIDKILTK